MKNILLYTDFTNETTNALNYGLSLAEKIGGNIFLFHNADFPMDYPGALAGNNIYFTGDVAVGAVPAFPGTTMPYAELEQMQKDKLQDMVATLRKKSSLNITVEPIFKWGPLTDNINSLIPEANIDLVIFGNASTNSFLERLTGTDIASVLNNIQCPVLIVPAEVRLTSFNQITYAAELVQSDFIFLQQLMPIAQALGAHVNFVHVNDPKQNYRERLDIFAAGLKKEFPNLNPELIELTGKTVAEGLENFINENGTDLLAVGHHKQGFFSSLFQESITDHLAFHAKVPLLSLPEKALP